MRVRLRLSPTTTTTSGGAVSPVPGMVAPGCCPVIDIGADRHLPQHVGRRANAAPSFSPSSVRGRHLRLPAVRGSPGHAVVAAARPGPGLVRRARARPALALPGHLGLGRPGQRGHAAADPGGPGRAGLPGLAGALADPGGAGRRAAGRGGAGLGPARLPAPGAAAARGRDRGGGAARRRAADDVRRAASRCPASGSTPRRPWRRSRTAPGTPCWTPTCAGCWPGRSAAPSSRRPRSRRPSGPAPRRCVPDDPATAARWAVAVMELGALVCTARAPRLRPVPGAPTGARGGWRAARRTTGRCGAPRPSPGPTGRCAGC